MTRGLAGDFNDGPAVLPEGFEVLVPVSPTRLLIISPVPSRGSSPQLTEEFARDVNERQVRAADELVLHHPAMAWPAGLALRDTTPAMPIPRISIGRSKDGQSPTEKHWPDLPDVQIKEVMRLLGGNPPLPKL